MAEESSGSKNEPASSTAPAEEEQSKSSWIDGLVLNGVKWAIENDSQIGDDYDSSRVADILVKLQEMLAIIVAKTDEISENDMPWYCFLSLVQVSETIKRQFPAYRDGLYASPGGDTVSAESCKVAEIRELADGVEFADWAYDDSYSILKRKLLTMNFVLLRLDTATEPGRVGHFIALNHTRKVALIGLKGTDTLSDVITDCVGKTITHKLDASFSKSEDIKEIQCHEGVFTAAQTMLEDIEELIRNLFLPCGYQVLLCGHSLGAGAACLLGVLLRSRIKELRRSKGSRLRVLAIAPPPVLNYQAALACAPYTISLVNNCDIVPRMSLSNLILLSKMMVAVREKLKEQERDPHDFGSAFAYVQDLMNIDQPPLLTPEEIDAFFLEISNVERLKSKGNLFVPGRVVTMYTLQSSSADEIDTATKEDKNKEKATDEVDVVGDDQDDDEDSPDTSKEIRAVVSNGAMRMLMQIELENTILDDHRTESYRQNVASLLKTLSDQEKTNAEDYETFGLPEALNRFGEAIRGITKSS
jgi:hypothetical protein